MSPASPQSNDLALPGLAHWWASASHPVRPASGGGGRFDPAMLAAVASGSLPAILVLPRVDGTGRPADPTDWYAGLTGSRNPELIDRG